MSRHSNASLFSYGLFGLPLALVALPIYVIVPQFYTERFGLSLTLVGAALLGARALDAFLDPVLGWWIDRRKSTAGYDGLILLSLPPLLLGFAALFHPPDLDGEAALYWFLACLVIVYIGYSVATITHQSWGAALTQAMAERTRVTAMREGCGLAGVILAAALYGLGGVKWLAAAFALTLIATAIVLLKRAARPATGATANEGLRALFEPLRNRRFRWLFSVLLLNGIAASIPATLFLFFVKDRLQLAEYAGLFLALYFIAAAISVALWARLAQTFGEARTWMFAIFLSVAVFVWVAGLPAGAAAGFGAVCILSGIALGADLVLAPALLTGVIAAAGHSGQREGAYFGLWSWATKMNLALAAGMALSLLEWLGYVPGVASAEGSRALMMGYAVLPCALKLIAGIVLWRAPLRNL
jgi:GPH family glycoside/pentoside/hexuronide:cation symporter